MILLLATLALAAPGTEIALVLDNSGSMFAPHKIDGKEVPPNDPERTAVLGTLIVEGLVRGSPDRLSVIGFGDTATSAPRVVTTGPEIREIPMVGGTFFREALKEARLRLESSDRDGRLLIFFTDGAPNDIERPDEVPSTAGLDANPTFDSLVLGLYASDAAKGLGERFLAPLARTTDDLVFMNDPAQVVPAFTRGYARALGSKPLVGTLKGGESRTFDVPRYVVEVLAVTASSRPGPEYTSALEGPSGPITPQAKGDNGCSGTVRYERAEHLCDPPRRHYAVYRSPNDPGQASRWELSLPSAPGEVEYGVIYRYDLVPTLALPPSVRVGDTIPVSAELVFRGQTFADEAFFAADGFVATLEVAGTSVPLTHAGGGKFTGTWLPDTPAHADHPATAVVRFKNNWMDLATRRPVVVEGFLDLVLNPTPSPVDLGAWRGERAGTRHCQQIDLSASTNADRVPLTCTPTDAPPGFALGCNPVPGSEAMLGNTRGQPLRWEVCLDAPRCCGAAVSPGGTEASVRLAGTHAHYANAGVVVPVRFDVQDTGWLRCWWPLVAAGSAALFGIWVVVGFVRPNNFDPSAAVRIAGSEAGLKRVGALGVREQPGARRGFYRNARLCISADGNCIRAPRLAVLVVEAGPAATTRIRKAAGLEKKSRSSGKWEAVDATELATGWVPGVVYRLGGLHVKFE